MTLRAAALLLLASASLLGGCASRGREAPLQGDAGGLVGGAEPPSMTGVVAVPAEPRSCVDAPACEDACLHGSASDCLTAAGDHASGNRVPRDEARAASLLASACELRSGPGCNLAGRMHEFGHGVPRDAARALSFYEQACGLEYMGGCYNVAVMLENGRGAARDPARAVTLYRKVCAAGSQTACAAAERLGP